MKQQAARYILIDQDLYRRGYSRPLLKCLNPEQVTYVMTELPKFDLPQVIITDNGRQFTDRGLAEFYVKLHIKHVTSSVEHPQTNSQAEAANKVILNDLKKRLGPAKGNWTEELLEVLWAYRCTPQSTTQETPYSLTYDTEAMIPVEIGEPSLC
ncbi:uncharacterized protein [Phaseolus vulgaris]|uniref:uncharacterized protein n=1 Tax=Phaseolus vulgaris TaxID=3885 RepID=UPI0035CC3CAE